MSHLRVAVVGCGHLGRIHARLLKTLKEIELVGVADPFPAAREQVAAECECQAFARHGELIGQVDAAVVATPTQFHHPVALELLQHGIHLLIEKPITSTVAQANQLIDHARTAGLVLQVGHVERFNSAWNAAVGHLQAPQYIEAVRAGTYTFRATDVSIVLDLMIHDLDLILSVVKSSVTDVEAMGLALFGPHEDLAMARLKFANGCIANLKASRVNHSPQRTMQVFARNAFASIDFAQGQTQLIRPAPEVLAKTVDLTRCPPEQQRQVQENMFHDLLRMESVTADPVNAILDEQRDFCRAIREGKPVRVGGEQGRDALAVAEQILSSIQSHHWNGLASDQVGPHAILAPSVSPTKRAA
ncbi:MAG: Gfo/Idh/MocA family protein [Planctomycetota bacterium]